MYLVRKRKMNMMENGEMRDADQDYGKRECWREGKRTQQNRRSKRGAIKGEDSRGARATENEG